MTTIYFSVTDNRIKLLSREVVVSENYQNYQLDFSFDAGWTDLAKVVTLKTGSGDPVSIPYSGPFVLPAGAASVGGMKVSVSGYLGTEPMTVARTAAMAHDIPILPAGIAPELPDEYDPTTLDMIFAAIGDLSSLSTQDKRSLVLAINETLVDANDYTDQRIGEVAGYVTAAQEAAQEAAQSAAASSASSTAAATSEGNARSAADNAAFNASLADFTAARARLFAESASISSSSASSNARRASDAKDAAVAAQGRAEAAAATFETDKTLTVSDKAADAKVTGEWITAVFPREAGSGGIVSFPDGADGIPFMTLKANVDAVQAGSGDPSPSNIRAISGHTGVTVTRTGKNLAATQPVYGETLTIVDFGHDVTIPELTISFDADGASCSSPSATLFDLRKADGTHSYRAVSTFADENGTTLSLADTSYTGRFRKTYTNVTLQKVVCYYKSDSYCQWAADKLSNFQVELGDTATEYEAYSADEAELDWTDDAGAVGGGEADILGGTLKKTHEMITFDGTETWNATGTTRYYYYTISDDDTVAQDEAICSHAEENPLIASGNQEIGFRVYYSSGASESRFIMRPPAELGITGTEDFKDWLAAQATAETPVQVCYKLDTPEEYELTGDDLTTLLGVNNVWADTGDVSVAYRADTAKYIDRKIAEALASL